MVRGKDILLTFTHYTFVILKLKMSRSLALQVPVPRPSTPQTTSGSEKKYLPRRTTQECTLLLSFPFGETVWRRHSSD